MSANLQYSVLTRLLTLNNQVHDLENTLLSVPVPETGARAGTPVGLVEANSIATMQDQIDQGIRASLTTCWLGMPEDPED